MRGDKRPPQSPFRRNPGEPMSFRSSDPSVASLRDLLERYGIAAGGWPKPTVGSRGSAPTIDPFASFGEGVAPQSGSGSTPGMRLAPAAIVPGMRLADARSTPGFSAEPSTLYRRRQLADDLSGSDRSELGDGDTQVAQHLGDRLCVNHPRKSYVTGMYSVSGRILCKDCAVKKLGFGDLPSTEVGPAMRPYLLRGP